MTESLEPVAMLQRFVTNFPPDYWHHVGRFPREFATVDLETTGFAQDSDLIVQVGYLYHGPDNQVRNRVIDCLNWYEYQPPFCDPAQWPRIIEERMEKVARSMSTARKSWRLSAASLAAGRPAIETLEKLWDFLHKCFKHNIVVAGHSLAFDERFLVAAFDRFLNRPGFYIPEHLYFDTGVLVRGAQSHVFPQFQESWKKYSRRATHSGKGLKWGLDGDFAQAILRDTGFTGTWLHDAGRDIEACCWLIRLLIEWGVGWQPSVKTTTPTTPPA